MEIVGENLMENYTRECPTCNTTVYHKTERGLKLALWRNTSCRVCVNIGRKHTNESKSKMSNKKIGKPTWSSIYRKEMSIKISGKSHPFYGKHHSKETIENQRNRMIGHVFSEETKRKLSQSSKKAWKTESTQKKYYDALCKTKWLKTRCDIGQLELLEKWNKLGFNFEPNYQVKTNTDLFYVDGYDKDRNVVLEFDSKYHLNNKQKEKDMIRQNKIMDILKPKKFWRYNNVSKTFNQLTRKEG